MAWWPIWLPLLPSPGCAAFSGTKRKTFLYKFTLNVIQVKKQEQFISLNRRRHDLCRYLVRVFTVIVPARFTGTPWHPCRQWWRRSLSKASTHWQSRKQVWGRSFGAANQWDRAMKNKLRRSWSRRRGMWWRRWYLRWHRWGRWRRVWLWLGLISLRKNLCDNKREIN